MTVEKKTPNKKGEFLLDVTRMLGEEKRLAIYDLSFFLPHWECPERDVYFTRITHSIQGNNFVVHIIDSHNALNLKSATKLSGDWFNGDTIKHRLD